MGAGFEFYRASPFLKHQSASFTPCENSDAMMRDEPYQGRQMGLLIFDRQADIGFWFYLQSLHRVEKPDSLHLQSDKGLWHAARRQMERLCF